MKSSEVVEQINMASQLGSVVVLGLLIVVGCAVTSSVGQPNSTTPTHFDVTSLNRSSFPVGFIFGAGSSSYQFEGAARQGGKGENIWDNFTHKYPEKIIDGSNGDVAIDQYDRYKKDVRILKEMNLDSYRFSISWTRLLPKGNLKLSGKVNQEGINYYNNLINETLAKGLTPFVTLFHWDVPQALEDEYGGFLSPLIVEDFKDYAELCFKEFGDRVKHWTTLNEPWSFSNTGYASGIFAPGRCSDWQELNCTGGDSGTEPYWVAHHQILAHAAAVKVYRDKYQASQKGVIGITLVSFWFIPQNPAHESDRKAAQRALDFMLGWFLNPLTFGEYPHSMRVYVGKRLPKFKPEEVKLVQRSFDFLGLNYYTSFYALDQPRNQTDPHYSYTTDAQVLQTPLRDGVLIGPLNGSAWIFYYPRGIYDLLLHVKKNYLNPVIYITENGIDEPNNSTIPLEKALIDIPRISYHQGHLSFLHKAIKHGVKLKGYFAWSLLDNFEWNSGYTVRFGFNYVDYKHGLRRHPKLSAHWFKAFLKK